LYKRRVRRTAASRSCPRITIGTLAAESGMNRRTYANVAAQTWSTIRFGTGMAILSVAVIWSPV